MLHSQTKSKFYTKCKSLLKMTMTRLGAMKKKKAAVAKYLKNDVADLLRTGLDYNAYNRAESLLDELKMVKCYDFIEQFCDCISANLAEMNSQRECPDNCKEAVQSLIYVAARVSEFPELRDLRAICSERYGTSLEAYVSKELVEMIRQHATKEMKLQLLHEMAQEFSIDWNSKSLEQKLFIPPVPKHDSRNTQNEKSILQKRNVAEEKSSYKRQISREHEVVSAGYVDTPHREILKASSSSGWSVSEDKVESKDQSRYRSVPPPFIMSNGKKEEAKIEETPQSKGSNSVDVNKPDSHGVSADKAEPTLGSVQRTSTNHQRPVNDDEGISSIEKPLKPPPGHIVDQVKRVHTKRASRVSHSQSDKSHIDEEEKTLDRLLLHYSMQDSHHQLSNKPSPYLKHPHSRQKSSNSTEPIRLRSSKSEPSLAFDNVALAKEDNTTTPRHARALSLEPEKLAGHVHPNLPDYDDLAARIASFQGR